MPELFTALSSSIFQELEAGSGGSYSNAKPLLSGVRRNLQREYVAMLIDLTLSAERSYYPRAASTQAWYQLRRLGDELDGYLGKGANGNLDDYSRAHLQETRERISRALSASFELSS